MIDEVETHPVVTGRVKWFDPVKGFGFIVAEGSGGDILLHANVLRNYGQSSIAENTEITVKVQKTQRGVQAMEVVTVAAPETAQLALSEEDQASLPEEVTQLALEPSRVKWFDKDKGFGFANVFGRPEDVFVHVEVLRASGFADLQAGEAVCLRIIEGKRGRMAVQVVSWESSVRR
ncbi:MAG: cold shock domain-containing protein [Pseudorhodobacter sp.]|nr:cold shock domain-containing protein [Pseudorhodobacter sp.]